ncbi:hypothetical protein [Pokkaliibacter plantistimulans]|uniref:hypothetical protein n=1 Tax=Pokkaliibacter plantistimulans TaxID=1635171 RepID=UPI000D7427A6|nr:hypothetical protein [Pokkaliibacter plantistimulans]
MSHTLTTHSLPPQEQSDYHYADTAYRFDPEHTYPLADAPFGGFALGGRGDPRTGIPNEWLNEELNECGYTELNTAEKPDADAHWHLRQDNIDAPIRMDHETLRAGSLGKYTGAFTHIFALGYMGKLLFWFSTVTGAIFCMAKTGQFSTDVLLKFALTFASIAAAAAAVWKGCDFILARSAQKMGSDTRPVFELCRRTGQVRLWHKTERYIEHDIPFTEMAPIVEAMYSPTHNQYRLKLVKPGTDIKVDLSQMTGVSSSKGDIERMWAFIQQYMDVSLPLADVPAFEPFRSIDPTTAAYDRHTQRNPRYWRDMDDQLYKDVIRLLRQEQYQLFDHSA